MPRFGSNGYKNGRSVVAFGKETIAVEAEAFRFKPLGGMLVVYPPKGLEDLDEPLTRTVAALLDQQLQGIEEPAVIVDLSGIEYFGSIFISLLLRFWGRVKARGGTMVLCGATGGAMEILRLSNLDTLCPVYETVEDAISALSID